VISSRVKAVRVRCGLYELSGVTHTAPRYPGAPACGGRVFAERFPGEWDEEGGKPVRLPPSWECFCERCLDCDPGGWDTLAECVREALSFWAGGV
jgi:hypothetical protein